MDAMIVSGGSARLEDVESLRDRADLRKATTTMLLSLAAIQDCLAPTTLQPASAWGLTVGVDYGELEVTKEFLQTLSTRGLARPFLFQSALHNATLGFLSRHFNLCGPGATTSTRWFSAEDALALAIDWIEGEDCEACLCVGVEAVDVQMRPVVEMIYGHGSTAGTGAGVVLVASEAFVEANGLESLARRVRRMECQRQLTNLSVPEAISGFFGSDAILRIVEEMRRNSDDFDLKLVKPDGSFSLVGLAGVS